MIVYIKILNDVLLDRRVIRILRTGFWFVTRYPTKSPVDSSATSRLGHRKPEDEIKPQGRMVKERR